MITATRHSLEPPSINRRLGATENIYWLLDQLYCLNFVVFAELDGPLELDRLNQALTAVQVEHPLLRARIVALGGVQWFNPLRVDDERPLTAEVRRLRNWRVQIAAQLDAPFERDAAPLARFLWFRGAGRSSVVAMVFHHAIADGKSGANLLLSVLRRAALSDTPITHRRANASSQDLDIARQKPPLLGSLQTLKFWLGKGKDALKFAKQLPGYDMEPRRERTIKVIPLVLPEATCAALSMACRRHGTSVHGALGAAQLLALNDQFKSAQARTLALNSLADLRPALSGGLSADDLGLYIATLTTVHLLDAKPDFWALAREIREQLRHVLDSGDGNLIHGIYQRTALAPDGTLAAAVQKLVALAPASSMLTNIGRVDTLALGESLRVRSLAFVVSPPPQHPICVTATSYDGRMFLNLLYDQCKLSARQAKDLADGLIAHIKAAASPARFD